MEKDDWTALWCVIYNPIIGVAKKGQPFFRVTMQCEPNLDSIFKKEKWLHFILFLNHGVIKIINAPYMIYTSVWNNRSVEIKDVPVVTSWWSHSRKSWCHGCYILAMVSITWYDPNGLSPPFSACTIWNSSFKFHGFVKATPLQTFSFPPFFISKI